MTRSATVEMGHFHLLYRVGKQFVIATATLLKPVSGGAQAAQNQNLASFSVNKQAGSTVITIKHTSTGAKIMG